LESDDFEARAAKSLEYFQQKFAYNAYLAVKQRDRFARFLRTCLRSLGFDDVVVWQGSPTPAT
jgi:hypothetical protein